MHISGSGRHPPMLLRRAGLLLLKLAAGALLILPILPIDSVFGPFPDDAESSARMWLLGIAIVISLSCLGAAMLSNGLCSRFQSITESTLQAPVRLYVGVHLCFLLFLLLLINATAFNNRPDIVDGVVQLFQAKIFASGLLVAPVPQLKQFFMTPYMVFDEQGWYSQYPPGHSLVLALGVLAGAPWVISPILGTLTALVVFLFVRHIYGERTAKLTLTLLAACPFFLFMSASYMNHVSAAFFIALTLLCYARWETCPPRGNALCSGAALGAAFLSRPICALIVGVVLGCCAIGELWSAKSIRHALYALFSFAGVASP